jgi:MFS family permease
MTSPNPSNGATDADATNQKPSHARYWVVFFALTLAILAYIDRVALSQSAPRVQRELGLSEQEMGLIFSAFALAYALFEIPGGFLGDWLGPKKVLIRIVLWWSAFTAGRGLVWNFWSMWIGQALFGAGEAGCFPNITKAFSVWLPKHERVRMQGLLWMFARWGGAFTPLLVIGVFGFVEGFGVPKTTSWRYAFMVFGAMGLIWIAAFTWWFKDDPAKHKGVNAGELALLRGVRDLGGGHSDVPWGKMIRSGSIWLLWAQYFCCSFGWYFFITFQPKYLQEYRHMTEAQSAQFGTMPLLAGGLGSLFAGLIATKVTRWVGSVSLGRKLLSCTGFAGAAASWFMVTQVESAAVAVMFMALASFSNDLNMPSAWGTCMDVGGKYAGTVSGAMNMMGNLAGFTMPAIGGYLLQHSGRDYNLLMYMMAGVYAFGALLWPFIDPVTPLEREEHH